MRAATVLLISGALLAGCGGGDGGGAEPTPQAVKTEGGPCEFARPKRTVEPPKTLIVPDGIEVEEVAPLPPNQKVAGYLPMTPPQFLKLFDRDRRLGILFRENELRDAEMMVTDGRTRSFWKLTQACPEGSRFTVLTGEELQPAAARRAIRRHRRKLGT